MKSTVTKEQVLEAMGECAGRLKRTPTKKEFRALTGISEKAVATRFGSFGSAVRAAGLVTVGPGYQASDEDLLQDWAAVVRKLGRFPTKDEYCANSDHSETPFLTRWKWWHKVGPAFELMTRQRGLEEQWRDVLELVRQDMSERGQDADEPPPPGRPRLRKQALDWRRGETRRPLLPGRPVYGSLLNVPGLAMAPVCEDGVIFVFGMLAHQLGFMVLRIRKEFPDCEALWEVQPGRWQWVRIEFEFESRNFARHGHDPAGCDLIVCWTHNWDECPKELEVVELRKEIARIAQNCQTVTIENLCRGFAPASADECCGKTEEVA